MAIKEAKRAGNWETAKAAPISEEQIGILSEQLMGIQPAFENFSNMPLSVKRTYTAHYLSAKSEDARRRRLMQIIERLNQNKRPM
jgi:uncharacterized protein YdeI (YjbR/CyaY-like superfamily)